MTRWTGLTVAVVGGDLRETELAQIAASHGADVRIFGSPPLPGNSAVQAVSSLEDAFEGAQVAILPVPLIGTDGSLYAPHAPAPIHVTEPALRRMGHPAHLITGKANDDLRVTADRSGVAVHEYEGDTDLMLLRAPAIAEGAVRVAIERSPVTVHASNVGVAGFGRIAAALTRTLVALNANVHVFARRADARAGAYALGAEGHDFAQIPKVFPSLQILYNSVPARVISEAELAHLPAGALAIDLAAPPGGVDLEAATRLGLDAFWARGLGASAPRTVAASQWIGVDRIIAAAIGGHAEDETRS